MIPAHHTNNLIKWWNFRNYVSLQKDERCVLLCSAVLPEASHASAVDKVIDADRIIFRTGE